jgi:hypothetical protein
MSSLNDFVQTNFAALTILTAFITVLLAVLSFMMLLIFRRQSSHYEQELQRAVLSAMRDSYETRIAVLNREMTATKERWEDANHLLLSAQKSPQQKVAHTVQPESEFLRTFRFRAPDFVVDPRLIIVLTPFSEDERRAFEIIQKTCTEAGFKCIRGDEEYTPSDILSHIVRLIVKARIVIANVTSRNPNVFYELGVAHAMGKQTILVSESSEVPFDIAGLRIVFWTNPAELRTRLTETLLRTISATALEP